MTTVSVLSVLSLHDYRITFSSWWDLFRSFSKFPICHPAQWTAHHSPTAFSFLHLEAYTFGHLHTFLPPLARQPPTCAPYLWAWFFVSVLDSTYKRDHTVFWFFTFFCCCLNHFLNLLVSCCLSYSKVWSVGSQPGVVLIHGNASRAGRCYDCAVPVALGFSSGAKRRPLSFILWKETWPAGTWPQSGLLLSAVSALLPRGLSFPRLARLGNRTCFGFARFVFPSRGVTSSVFVSSSGPGSPFHFWQISNYYLLQATKIK